MPIEAKDLNPVNSEIELNGVSYELSPFTLRFQVWADNFFKTDEEASGLRVLSERIQRPDDMDAVVDLCWKLLKRKEKFSNSREVFFKTVEQHENANYKLMEMRAAIVKSLGVSQPMIEDVSRELEIKKSLAAESYNQR